MLLLFYSSACASAQTPQAIAVAWVTRFARIIDHPREPRTSTATTLETANCAGCPGQGSRGQEEQTQYEHHRSLHVWIVPMVLRWSDPDNWSGWEEAYLLISKLLRFTICLTLLPPVLSSLPMNKASKKDFFYLLSNRPLQLTAQLAIRCSTWLFKLICCSLDPAVRPCLPKRTW